MSKHKHHRNLALSRRQLLTATGLAGASLFLPSLFGRGKARSQSAPIKRLVIFTTQHGPVPENWRMLRNNAGFGNWEYDFDDADPESFSRILRPLHAHRNKLLVVEGLAQSSAIENAQFNAHNGSHLHLLTSAPVMDETTAGGPSVDQVIANKVALPGRIPSLELSTNSGGLFIGGFVNAGAGQRLPTVSDPNAVFQRLFPSGATTGGSEPTEADLIRLGKQSVLSLVANEYDAIAPRLNADDRARLNQHRDLVRDLELRVGSLASLDCGAQTAPGSVADQVARSNAMSDMIAAAMACDLTRVATLQVSQLETHEFGAPAGDVHQDYAHQALTDPNAAEQMTKYHTVEAEMFAHLVNALDRYADGEGTLLDNTAVVWLTEHANGMHYQDRIPVVIAGGCGGYFRTGRYVSFAQDQKHTLQTDQVRDTPIGPAHSHLLVSLMQGMGLEDNQIGMPTIRAWDGSAVDLSGPLPRLT